MDIDYATLIWITRSVAFAFSGIIVIFVWRFMRRKHHVEQKAKPVYVTPENITLPEKDIVLTIMAKPGKTLDSLILFKTMHELGFSYNEDLQIFEYFLPDSQNIAFSIINIRPPHTFDPNPQNMRPTYAVVAVMRMPVADGDDQSKHFHLFLSKLDDASSNLNAQLCDAQRKAFDNQKHIMLINEIDAFEQSYLSLIQNDYKQNH